MRRAFFSLVMVYVFLFASTQSVLGDTFNARPAVGVISAARTYYVCAKAAGGTCAYNGDGGQVVNASCPSDSCSGLDKTHPKLTIGGVQAAIGHLELQAVVMAQLADTAGTGTDCYIPSGTVFDNPALGDAFMLWEHLDTNVQAEAYANAYIYIHGNDSTPGNVIISGVVAGNCASTTPHDPTLLKFANTTFRVRGVKFQYECGATCGQGFGGAIAVENAQGYVEDNTSLGDGNSVYVVAYGKSHVKFGGSTTGTSITNSDIVACMATSECEVGFTPLGRPSFTVSLTSNLGAPASALFLSGDKAHVLIDGVASFSLTGTGTGTIFDANNDGSVYWSDASTFTAPAQTWTINDANIVVDSAFNNGFIDDALRTVGSLTATFTACSKRASITIGGGHIYYVAGSCTNADTDTSTGWIANNNVYSFFQNGIMWSSSANPTFTSGFNTNGVVTRANGTVSFVITVGTGTAGSTGVIGLPTAKNGWNCWLKNQTRADDIQQTANSATSATFTNFGTTFAATNWTNSDVLVGGCAAN